MTPLRAKETVAFYVFALEEPMMYCVTAFDQDDLKDKQHQIAKIKLVYEKASRVLIWLGHVDRAESAAELIRDICDHIPTSITISGEEKSISRFKCDRTQEAMRFYFSNGLQRGTTGHGESHNEPFDPDRQKVSAFLNLLQQEWFTRVWCFQEAVASTNALVLTDTVEVPWVDVGFAGMYMELYGISLFSFEEARDGHRGLRNTKMVWFYWYNHVDGKQWKLLELLLTTDAFTSTYPEDKVFALCGGSSTRYLQKYTFWGGWGQLVIYEMEFNYSSGITESGKDLARNLY
ncbi:hypothetical protein OIDMADRAFT_26161 [Oidiodendron maius Zn]|uniref:Heterokaryon incompatibility domain-containing protein n=1 Tax=Oidiodendron maius (strain Zn) TaxID=913774 RepID=A0A0C3DN57_OIDMZ|nr:hypothetical protein OIDMADRAFT_26161 [Oidiodendron maius Zn]